MTAQATAATYSNNVMSGVFDLGLSANAYAHHFPRGSAHRARMAVGLRLVNAAARAHNAGNSALAWRLLCNAYSASDTPVQYFA